MSNKPKIAIVGVGRWGKNLLKELDKQADVIWACHGGSEESKKFLVENYPAIKETDNLQDIINDSFVESVIVATPTNTHFDIATKILDSGKNLFLEKPATTNSTLLETLMNKAGDKNLKFVVGYEFPHHPIAKKIKELIANKNVTSMHFEWNKWGAFYDDAVPHLLSHDISIIKYFGIKEVKFISHKRTKVISDSDIIETEFLGNKKTYIKSYINRVSTDKRKVITVVLEDKSYIWNNDDLFEINTETNTSNKIDVEHMAPTTLEIEDFLHSIKENAKPLTDGEFALEVYEIIEQVKI
ncbi:MAG: Gfo/Idh/MocA family oxidoreductase [Minisyncoccia bacterium]